jgi:hypothetical protein
MIETQFDLLDHFRYATFNKSNWFVFSIQEMDNGNSGIRGDVSGNDTDLIPEDGNGPRN